MLAIDLPLRSINVVSLPVSLKVLGLQPLAKEFVLNVVDDKSVSTERI